MTGRKKLKELKELNRASDLVIQWIAEEYSTITATDLEGVARFHKWLLKKANVV